MYHFDAQMTATLEIGFPGPFYMPVSIHPEM